MKSLHLTFNQAQNLSSVLKNAVKSYKLIMSRGGINDIVAVSSFIGADIDPEKISADEMQSQITHCMNDLQEIIDLIKQEYGI